jgi:hypothetical protein
MLHKMKQEKLTRNEKPEVVDVLTDAFYDYPVMRFILKTTGTEYERQLHAIMNFYAEARLAKGRPVIGVREGELLIAAALVDEASLRPWNELKTELQRLREIIGESAYSRLELYEKATGALEPAEPHYFLGMLGVRRAHQGRGYSRPILDKVRDLSMQDPVSTGVCLSTEDAENVKLYGHFGYQVIAESDIGELHSWCMFLPTR